MIFYTCTKRYRFQDMVELMDIEVKEFKFVELTYSPPRDFWLEPKSNQIKCSIMKSYYS